GCWAGSRPRLHSLSHHFPTRRSADLIAETADTITGILKLDEAGNGVTFEAAPGDVPSGGDLVAGADAGALAPLWLLLGGALLGGDRKSTRLNSSHVKISYGVFCLQQK